jgi:hypothetical protein
VCICNHRQLKLSPRNFSSPTPLLLNFRTILSPHPTLHPCQAWIKKDSVWSIQLWSY